MKRKVIKQGHNTLTLTLPHKWAEEFNIKAGDELDLEENGRTLRISSNKSSSIPETAVIDISGQMIPVVWRHISSAYRAGYDKIKILFDNQNLRDVYSAFTYDTINVLGDDKIKQLSPLEAIQSLVNRFVGIEIIEQKSNYCILKDLGHISEKEFDNALRRIFLLLKTMSDAIISAVEKKDMSELSGFHILDTNLDRFEDFCLRLLNKKGYCDFKKTSSMYSLVFLLELLGDEYKRMGIHIIKMDKIPSKELKTLIRHVANMVETYYTLYYKFSKEGIERIYKLDEEGAKMMDLMFSKLDDDEKEILHHLKKVGRFIVSLTELKIDLEY